METQRTGTRTNIQVSPESAPDSQPQKKKRAQRHSQNDRTRSSPTQLQFYPPSWRDVLEAAKNKFRCYISAVNPYPSREDGIREASDCVVEALADHRASGKKVDPGMIVFYCFATNLISNFVPWIQRLSSTIQRTYGDIGGYCGGFIDI